MRSASAAGLGLWLLALAPPAGALNLARFEELTVLQDSARALEAPVFAPKAWARALAAAVSARETIDRGRGQKELDQRVAESTERTEQAIKITQVARLSLAEYLPARLQARHAGAPLEVPELYVKAEEQLIRATAKVEAGDVKAGLEAAAKAVPLFDAAELEAIRKTVLNRADREIAGAEANDAGKFALTTLDRARSARRKADSILTADRYHRTQAAAEAERAAYEARHASHIALSVRSLKRNDQAWEKLMLIYEVQMQRIGEAAGIAPLPFDDGPRAAADTLIAYIGQRLADQARLSGDREAVQAELKEIWSRLGQEPASDDPVQLARLLDERLVGLLYERDHLSLELRAGQLELAHVSREQQELTSELERRRKREEKQRKARDLLTPQDGEVLVNAAGDLVLRLWGLSFDIGSSELKEQQMPLLERVKKIITLFPEARLVVEGHTDASGDRATNQLLSEKRALAVMHYLRASLQIPADRIQAVGYGAERPIASNQTADGRAKNRRNDIIIMQ